MGASIDGFDSLDVELGDKGLKNTTGAETTAIKATTTEGCQRLLRETDIDVLPLYMSDVVQLDTTVKPIPYK